MYTLHSTKSAAQWGALHSFPFIVNWQLIVKRIPTHKHTYIVRQWYCVRPMQQAHRFRNCIKYIENIREKLWKLQIVSFYLGNRSMNRVFLWLNVGLVRHLHAVFWKAKNFFIGTYSICLPLWHFHKSHIKWSDSSTTIFYSAIRRLVYINGFIYNNNE